MATMSAVFFQAVFLSAKTCKGTVKHSCLALHITHNVYIHSKVKYYHMYSTIKISQSAFLVFLVLSSRNNREMGL